MAQAPACHSFTDIKDITTEHVAAFIGAHSGNVNFSESVKAFTGAVSDLSDPDISLAKLTKPLLAQLFPTVEAHSQVRMRAKQIIAVGYLGPKQNHPNHEVTLTTTVKFDNGTDHVFKVAFPMLPLEGVGEW